MIELDKKLALEFLQKNGVACSDIKMVAGDASFRSYYRIFSGDKTYILMFAPPQYEDFRPFIEVDKYLRKNDLLAPEIFFLDEKNGFLLLEDFGDISLTKILQSFPEREVELYQSSINCLIELHQKEISLDVDSYNNAELMREVFLFIDWYLPLKNKRATQDEIFSYKTAFFNLFDDQPCKSSRFQSLFSVLYFLSLSFQIQITISSRNSKSFQRVKFRKYGRIQSED